LTQHETNAPWWLWTRLVKTQRNDRNKKRICLFCYLLQAYRLVKLMLSVTHCYEVITLNGCIGGDKLNSFYCNLKQQYLIHCLFEEFSFEINLFTFLFNCKKRKLCQLFSTKF
jgi:hypothetical protein